MLSKLKPSQVLLLALPVFLVLYVFIPKRTIIEVSVTHTTSLADSIPIEYYQQLNVVEKQGIRFFDKDKVITYLEYETDPQALLKIIASLPFSKFAVRADTVCIETGFYGFATIRNAISTEEQEAGSYFWNIEPNDYQVFECIKGYEKHTLLINRDSDQVLHRIEYTS